MDGLNFSCMSHTKKNERLLARRPNDLATAAIFFKGVKSIFRTNEYDYVGLLSGSAPSMAANPGRRPVRVYECS